MLAGFGLDGKPWRARGCCLPPSKETNSTLAIPEYEHFKNFFGSLDAGYGTGSKAPRREGVENEMRCSQDVLARNCSPATLQRESQLKRTMPRKGTHIGPGTDRGVGHDDSSILTRLVCHRCLLGMCCHRMRKAIYSAAEDCEITSNYHHRPPAANRQRLGQSPQRPNPTEIVRLPRNSRSMKLLTHNLLHSSAYSFVFSFGRCPPPSADIDSSIRWMIFNMTRPWWTSDTERTPRVQSPSA